nr:uncharacterized protein LOC109191482 [Ipomoea batatas]
MGPWSLIRWRKPPKEWLKINVDGSFDLNTKWANCGGLVRNNHDDWLKGFSYGIGTCSVEMVEAWALLKRDPACKRDGIQTFTTQTVAETRIVLDRNSVFCANLNRSHRAFAGRSGRKILSRGKFVHERSHGDRASNASITTT